MLTELQKKACQAIVNIFETSQPRGDYGKVTVIKGDRGHLTYGRSQTTLSSGNLYLLIKAYCDAENAIFARELGWYLDRFLRADTSLDHDMALHNLLRVAGDDPVMQDVQDQFFDRAYWTPSVNAANTLEITSALGIAVVYDSKIHGSWKAMRNRTNTTHGTVESLGEQAWIGHYVNVRRSWLANHRIPILRKTIYRMDAFLNLMQQSNWELNLPFYVRGIRIDEGALEPNLPRASAEESEKRLLFLDSPYIRGDDVKEIQEALVQKGYKILADGIFGKNTDTAVKQFQSSHSLISDGIVGPVTFAALGL